MFKPRKSPENQPSIQRLPIIERLPKREEIVSLFTSALQIKHTLFELPIKPITANSIFLLTCYLDKAQNQVVWSLSEGGMDVDAVKLWEFPQDDFDVIVDLVRKACQPKNLKTETPLVSVSTTYEQIKQQGTPHIPLGRLLTETGIISEHYLEAALKIQEMVEQGNLNKEQAIRALKRAKEKAGHLDDEIIAWAKNFNEPLASQTSQDSIKQEIVAIKKAVELLKQSGLISQDDLAASEKVKAKHGGNLGQILVAAKKISGRTLEAALQCQEYMQYGRLRTDQAIMALHCCDRMHTTLRESLSELKIELQ